MIFTALSISTSIIMSVLLLRSMKLRQRRESQYEQLTKRYEEEVMSNLTQRENWLYEIEGIQSHLVFHIIHLLPEEEANTFKRRQADLNYRMETTRYQSSGLSVEQMLLEDDFRAFKNDLLAALKETFH